MTSSPRNFAAEYHAARLAYRAPTADIAAQNDAVKLSNKILRAADRADVNLDVIAIDEAARLELYPR